MRFEDERYVRLYTRDTTTWLMLRWEGQSVFTLLLRKVDRIGVFDLGGSDPVEAVAAVIQMPEDLVRVGLERLLSRGVIEHREDCLIFPKFLEAQESTMTPNARAKESRLRRRDMLRQGLDPNARTTVVYFVQSEHGGPIKIGHANDLAKRLVGLQTSRPDKLVVLAAAPGTVGDERAIHDRFTDIREKGEWFSATPELMAYVKHVAVTRSLSEQVTNGSESHIAPVTSGDRSQNETGHDTRPVTPCLAVPSHAVPDPPHPPEGVRVERLVELGTAACVDACEVYVATLAEAGWTRPEIRERWERQALCDAINAHLRADETLGGVVAELRRAVREWADAYREGPQFTSGWGARKFSEWLSAGRKVVMPRRPLAAPGTASAPPARRPRTLPVFE